MNSSNKTISDTSSSNKEAYDSNDQMKVMENNDGFDIIFKHVPKISLYQSLMALFGMYLTIPAGAIQLGAVVMQANIGICYS